jgi:hypothetical protein
MLNPTKPLTAKKLQATAIFLQATAIFLQATAIFLQAMTIIIGNDAMMTLLLEAS